MERCMRRVCKGFTLIEIMIAVGIVSLVASFAVPSFYGQLKKSRRADAVVAISQIQQAQERWRANNPAYGTLINLELSANTTAGYYTLSVQSPTATGYAITANAASGTSQASDTGCSTLTVTVSNGNASNSPTGCWSN